MQAHTILLLLMILVGFLFVVVAEKVNLALEPQMMKLFLTMLQGFLTKLLRWLVALNTH